ncbi:MAG: acetyl-CoA C-acyltransferase [Candidatus Sericytochromatia bacterium]|nr:acetyl-CoA C-acyltransferase [Candidatus Tanganyikabacteria bacterium]
MAPRRLSGRRVVIVDGCRTPFLRSMTDYMDLMSYDLGTMAVSALLARSRLDPGRVDRLILGTVIADVKTSNVAREVALAAGLPLSVPAYTVTAACTSSNVAIASGVEAIAAGVADIVIAGGTETSSDVPIRFSRPLRKRLIASTKVKGPGGYLGLLKGVKLKDFAPDAPAIAEFSTGLTMGDNAERLAKAVGLTREEQDRYALSSHHRAAKAHKEGLLADQIAPVSVPPKFAPITFDNGVRADSTYEKLSTLPPVFDRKFGTVTAGNSSFLTDGASAVLLMSEEKAQELGYEPIAAITATAMVALDPVEELLLGPALAVPAALEQAGVGLADVGVFEIHEAFAAPVLAVTKLFKDARWCRDRLGLENALGEIDPARLNAWGGSLSIGHPFGATGARLMMTAARRLKHEKARYGVVSACAAGALGHAMVLERA